MTSPTLTRSVDGRLIRSYPLGGGLFRITIDGEPHPDIFSSDDLRAIITGRYRLDFSAESPIDATDDYLDHGHQGIIFQNPDTPDLVTKLVFLPRGSLVRQRRMERTRGLDPWRSFFGSSILASNRQQADLFSELAQQPGPASLPRVTAYREGPLDASTRRSIIASGLTDERIPPIGWPIAAWTMERLQPTSFTDSETDRSRRQALDYLWREHEMVVRDIGGDSGNWAARADGTPVLVDPLVVDVSVMMSPRTSLPTTYAGIRRFIRSWRRIDEGVFINNTAPFGVTLEDGSDSLAMSLLAISLAYRESDPMFDRFIDDYRMGMPSGFEYTYLGYPHRRRPFM